MSGRYRVNRAALATAGIVSAVPSARKGIVTELPRSHPPAALVRTGVHPAADRSRDRAITEVSGDDRLGYSREHGLSSDDGLKNLDILDPHGIQMPYGKRIIR